MLTGITGVKQIICYAGIIVMLIIDKKALPWYINNILASGDGVESSNRV
jgi:hypothetical protein